MYNKLYRYFTEHSILYSKQFGFQRSNSTEHAIIQLYDQICESFEQNKFTLGVFIDFSKDFDTGRSQDTYRKTASLWSER